MARCMIKLAVMQDDDCGGDALQRGPVERDWFCAHGMACTDLADDNAALYFISITQYTSPAGGSGSWACVCQRVKA